jgi:2-polyprenyl-3-methyl-5-hydroxy-6-metoxy-1,4-benzoquinol methylase
LETCLICGESSVSFLRPIPGYAGGHHNVYFCSNCDSQQAPDEPLPKELYNWMYRDAEVLGGYNRYFALAKGVLRAAHPLDYLAESEDMYWAVREFLRGLPVGARVLEIGSGLGYLTYALRQAGYDAWGLDLSQAAVEQATQRFGPYYRTGDATAAPSPEEGTWDAIILTEVIEHLEDPSAFLTSLRVRLAPNSRLLVTTPNRSFRIPAFTALEGPLPPVWDTELPPVHRTWISEQGALCLAERCGYEAELMDFTHYPHNYLHHLLTAVKGSVPRTPAYAPDGTLLAPAPYKAWRGWVLKVGYLPGVAALAKFALRKWNTFTAVPGKRRPTLALVLRSKG